MYRYRKLGYLSLGVTDLERSIAFYRDMVGLALAGREGKLAFLRCSAQHHELALHQSTEPGLKRIAFEMESAGDLAAAEKSLGSLGIAIEQVTESESRTLHIGRAIRYRVPGAGLPFELYERMDAAPAPFQPHAAKIERLGHVVLQVKHWQQTLDWLMQNANFRTSDFVGGVFAFLRPFPNPLHHSLALGKSERTHLHHLMFMVSDIDDIGRALNRFRKGGVPVTFGPGRHVASGSIFLYFSDPDGMTIEYSFGMERFEEHSPRPARILEPSLETVDEWGGAPTPEYARQGEIEGAL